MRFTNRYNIHPAITHAIDQRDRALNPDRRRISVTTLIAPPQIAHLKRAHGDDIIRDYSEMMPAFFGTALHAVIEDAGFGTHEVKFEQPFEGWTIVGQVDFIDDDGTIVDWKTQSVWQFMHRDNDDHERQLNAYAWLARRAGHNVTGAKIAGIIRDWQKRDAAKVKGYPPTWYGEREIALWPDAEVERYVRERLEMFARDSVPYCTDEERWYKPEGWAVKATARARAIKVFADLAEAVDFTRGRNGAKLKIEHRPAEFPRCELYCDVSAFCRQWADENRVIRTKRERLGNGAADVGRASEAEATDRPRVVETDGRGRPDASVG